MTKFFFKFKKTYFRFISSLFVAKNVFPKKSGCHAAQLHKSFWHHGKILRNLMIKFQENTLTDVRREGWADTISQDPSSYWWGGGGAKRKDGPFRLPPGVQKDVNKIWKLFPLSLNRFGLDDVIDLKIIDKLVLKCDTKSVTEIWYLTKL